MVSRRLPILRIGDGIDFPDLKDEVIELQQKLGLLADDINSKFGPATEAAVKRFQSDKGLIVDGVVGHTTWTALLNEVVEVFTPYPHFVGSFDVDKILASIPFPNIRSNACTSVPIILNECLASEVTDRGQIAYILATAENESHLGEFIVELANGWDYEGRIKLGNIEPGDGPRFKGRGYVQIIGRRIYTYWSNRLGVNLVDNPDKVTEPSIAAKILVQGMRDGTFTGLRLGNFINGANPDFVNARRIINYLDRANKIAAIAKEYLKVL